MRTVILCGRRPDGGQRDRIWRWCRARWEEQTGWPVHVGYHTADEHELFSLAIASNRAAAQADMDGRWDTALYVGGEHFVALGSQADRAVKLARGTGRLVFAHDHMTLLDEAETELVLAGVPVADVRPAGRRHPNTFSGAVAVPRDLWGRVRGFDERFTGWGWEDLAFWSACNAVGGGFQRVPGDAYHLWHPRSRAENEEQPFHSANQVLGERYLAAKNNPKLMLEIISERGEG